MSLIGRVLIMDDEEAMREMLTIMLDHMGHMAVVATDGAEAVALFRDAKRSGDEIDAVILDLTVRRGLGGKETMVRLLEVDPGVQVIVSSGLHSDPVMANYRDYGFRAALCKPYEMVELEEILESLLGNKTSSAATPSQGPSDR